MVDLKKKYSKIFKEKFQGGTVTSNIVDTRSDIQTHSKPTSGIKK